MALHGLPKMKTPFTWMGPDAPVAGVLQALAALSEFGGGVALLAGLLTPLACLGIMSTMFVATLMNLTNKVNPTYFVKPQGAPGDSYESAAMYFAIALALLLTGPGLVSLDALIFGKNKKRGGRF